MKGKSGKKKDAGNPSMIYQPKIDVGPHLPFAKGGKVKKAKGESPKPRSDKKSRGEKKNFIAGAIHHPGREKKRAAEHGISVHEQMEKDSHSKNPSLRGAGALGLRLSKMAKKK